MDANKLTPRLAAVCALAAGAQSVADVGTDHGHVSIWLLRHGGAAHVTATDLRPGPLAAARRNAEAAGLSGRIRFVLCDGLDFDGAEAHDAVLMAGMGGETIQGILSRAPWTRGRARLVLQPQSKLDELCLWLRENGYALETARLAEDAGRLYVALAARGGAGADCLYAEDALLSARDPLLARWLAARLARERRVLRGLERAKDSPDKSGAENTIQRLEATRKEL